MWYKVVKSGKIALYLVEIERITACSILSVHTSVGPTPRGVLCFLLL
jgi:hypothetical protein